MAKNNWAKEAFRKAQNLLSREYGDFEPATVVTKDELSTLKNTLLDDDEIQRQNEANWLKMEETPEVETTVPSEAETIPVGEPEPEIEVVLPQISAPFNLDLQKKIKNNMKPDDKDYTGFVSDWSKNYHTGQNPAKEKAALSALNRYWSVPKEAKTALDTASYIFEEDSGFTKEELYEYGANTGQVESRYKTKIQGKGGPARSYWQVEPKTALDLLNNSYALFGRKFEEKFYDKYGSDGISARAYLASLSQEEMSKLLVKDDALAATLALGVYVRSR